MNFGTLLKRIEINKRFYLNLYFTVGTIVMLSIFVFYAEVLRRQATRSAKVVPDLVSNFMYYSGRENFESILAHYILREIIANISYPIIITDVAHIPIFWKNIDVDENTYWDELTHEEQAKTIRRLDRMREKGHFIPLHNVDESYVFGYTFFEDSLIMRRLKQMPYVEAAVVILFMSFGILGIILLKRYEQRMIWVGLAKETAHQLGTPISSLIGWIDFLKIKIGDNPQSEELLPLLDDMTIDVELLKKVASRFGKVGSVVELHPEHIDIVINNSIEYFQKRLPHLNNEITIHYESKNPDTVLMLDMELMQWAIENIIKNSIDAMIHKSGSIRLTSYRHEKKFIIIIKDEGKGINKSILERIFEPGVTSKKRGWGLGLSLTKRIIEDYHQGKIRALDTTEEKGATFEITLYLNPDH